MFEDNINLFFVFCNFFCISWVAVFVSFLLTIALMFFTHTEVPPVAPVMLPWNHYWMTWMHQHREQWIRATTTETHKEQRRNVSVREKVTTEICICTLINCFNSHFKALPRSASDSQKVSKKRRWWITISNPVTEANTEGNKWLQKQEQLMVK